MKNISETIKIIHLLSDGQFHSMVEISTVLSIDINRISDHIKRIYNWGLEIFVIPNLGYCLCNSLHMLNISEIYAHLINGRLTILSVINSTNQYLIERINNIQSGDACVAEHQTDGRGRQGKTWISLFGKNLCLSMYWKFKHVTKIIGLSLMVSIITAELLQDLGIVGIRIKWPNDLYLKDRKLAGILVEMFTGINNLVHVIIGIGINLSMPASSILSNKIHQHWINLEESGIYINRNILIAKLVNKLRNSLKIFELSGFKLFMHRWYILDNCLNKPVKLFINNQEINGIARGINAYGSLMFEYKNEIRYYSNGEISLRSS